MLQQKASLPPASNANKWSAGDAGNFLSESSPPCWDVIAALSTGTEPGNVTHLKNDLSQQRVYNADAARRMADENSGTGGLTVKLSVSSHLCIRLSYLTGTMRYSPYAALQQASKEGIPVNIPLSTLYRCIDYFPVSANQLPVGKRRRRKSACASARRDFNCPALERSCCSSKPRTKIYDAHPFSSFERVSNENANRLKRRFLPKESRFDELTQQHPNWLFKWINRYPRKLLNSRSARQAVRDASLHYSIGKSA